MKRIEVSAELLRNVEIVALDPSLRRPGVAVFRAGMLIASDAIGQDNSDTGKEVLGDRITRNAQSVVRWILDHSTLPRVLVVEWPQVYAAVKSKGDPNDLLAVAGVGAAVSTMLAVCVANNARGVALDVRYISPADWCGQLPKIEKQSEVWNSPRTRRIVSRLSRQEKEVVTMRHDAIDAIGIGLHVLGRMIPTRIFPGATQARELEP